MALSLPRLTRGSAPAPRPKNFEKNNGNPPARRQTKPAGRSGNNNHAELLVPTGIRIPYLSPRLPPRGIEKGASAPFFIFS